MKTCTNCKAEKKESEFQTRRASPDGLTSRCRKCLSEYDKRRANLPHRKAMREAYQKTDAYLRSARKAKMKYADKNKDKVFQANKAYRERNPKKYKCHGKVAFAIKTGILIRQPCEICKDNHSVAHHDDYDKPLEVRWLCDYHHKQWHKYNGEGRNANEPQQSSSLDGLF